MISADPVPVGGDPVWILPPQECEMMDHINVEGQGNTFSAYIARPKTSPTSAVVVLQELFGVNADIRKHCDALAEEGFLAVAPDLFWRQEPGSRLCRPSGTRLIDLTYPAFTCRAPGCAVP